MRSEAAEEEESSFSGRPLYVLIDLYRVLVDTDLVAIANIYFLFFLLCFGLNSIFCKKDTSPVPRARRVFSLQLGVDYWRDCDSSGWKKRPQAPEEILPSPQSKHHRPALDKTSQQEEERDKWRRRKNLLV